MLTYDSLIEQAKIRGMPHTKLRGILREYLQVLILKELYKPDSGRRLYFTGRTYLRLIHGLKRFSEDLDFNTNTLTKSEFEHLLQKVSRELNRGGIESQVGFAHWGRVLVAKLIFPRIEKVYNAVSKYSRKQGIIIKVETNRLRFKIRAETEVISGFGELYPCVCTAKGVLFADKIDALRQKNRGRHIYDVLFMLSHNYPIERKVLRLLGIKGEPLVVLSQAIARFSQSELKKQAEILRPFLFEESQAELIINAHKLIHSLIEKYNPQQ